MRMRKRFEMQESRIQECCEKASTFRSRSAGSWLLTPEFSNKGWEMGHKGWVSLFGALIPFMFQGGGGMDHVTLKGSAAQVSVAIGGGGLVEFRMTDQPTNPLNWELAAELEARTQGKPY